VQVIVLIPSFLIPSEEELVRYFVDLSINTTNITIINKPDIIIIYIGFIYNIIIFY
jgi:hypothetical protein